MTGGRERGNGKWRVFAANMKSQLAFNLYFQVASAEDPSGQRVMRSGDLWFP